MVASDGPLLEVGQRAAGLCLPQAGTVGWHAQPNQTPHLFTWQMQRHLRRHQQARARGAVEPRLQQRPDGSGEVLAVEEHQQAALPGQHPGQQHRDVAVAVAQPQTAGLRDHLRDAVAACRRAKVDPPNAVGKATDFVPPELAR